MVLNPIGFRIGLNSGFVLRCGSSNDGAGVHHNNGTKLGRPDLNDALHDLLPSIAYHTNTQER